MSTPPTPDPAVVLDLFERSPDMLACANVEGRLEFVNPAWSEALGHGAAALAGRLLLDLVHDDDRAAAEAALRPVLDGGDRLARGEHRFAHRDGTWRRLRWRAVRAGAAAGARVHVIASDATADRAELDAAMRELEALTASISHDLRAPLRAIDGFSRILLDRHAAHLPDDTRRFLGVVREGATELATLLDDLVEVSRIIRGPLHPADVEPSAIATAVVTALGARHPARRVEWTVGAMPATRADPDLVRGLYEALLDNALKFTDERSPAHIEAAWDDGAGAYVVRDDGVGFDDAQVAKAFGIFQRLHSRDRYPGSGVGLAVAARIVARHGGRIWARSRPGDGAAFWFTLPEDDPHGRAGP